MLLSVTDSIQFHADDRKMRKWSKLIESICMHAPYLMLSDTGARLRNLIRLNKLFDNF